MSEVRFSMEFRTMSSDGLLLYVPGSNRVDFLRLELVNSKLILEWNLGSGTGRLESDQIVLGKWTAIDVKRKDLEATLTVYDGDQEKVFTGQSKAGPQF